MKVTELLGIEGVPQYFKILDFHGLGVEGDWAL